MIIIPDSRFRRILFWMHLSAGVSAGLLILLMSVTGVLLAYERQIIAAGQQANRVELPANAQRLDADALALAARKAAPPDARIELIFDADPAMPVAAVAGRDSLLLHPVTGAVLEDRADRARRFFRATRQWHRWLGGDARSPQAVLIDLANLLFLFIITSGIYLWPPVVWRWRTVRAMMLLQRKYSNARARNFNWHHVFSFWMLIPLFLIALSGVVMSYPWANRMLFAAYGETVPAPGRPSGAAVAANGGAQDTRERQEAAPAANYAALMAVARTQFVDWRRITLPLDGAGPTVQLSAELKSDQLRAPRQTLTLSRADASVVALSPRPPSGASAQTSGQRARSWMRFIHTGEQYGILGQTIAMLASLAACFLVYSGLALAWRRLVVR
jgi:uncharacterized iron-regulated membrane protein